MTLPKRDTKSGPAPQAAGTVRMVSITWHTANGQPAPVGLQYDAPEAEVDNLINLNYARRVEDLESGGAPPAAPTVASLNPATAVAGAAASTVQVLGTGFIAGAVVVWNGVDKATTVVSPTEVTAPIDAADVAAAAVVPVAVRTTAGTSAAVNFTVTAAGTRRA